METTRTAQQRSVEYQEWLDSLPDWRRAEFDAEDRAYAMVRMCVTDLVEAIADYPSIWRCGDGFGGCVLAWIYEDLAAVGLGRRPARERASPRRTPPVPYPMRYAVMERDGFRRLACGVQKDLTMDHDLPQSRGGENTLANLQTLCKSCNSSKGTKTNAEWGGVPG